MITPDGNVATLSPRCADVTGRTLLWTLVSYSEQLILSLFLESLHFFSKAILNASGISIGQIAGNGVELSISGQVLPQQLAFAHPAGKWDCFIMPDGRPWCVFASWFAYSCPAIKISAAFKTADFAASATTTDGILSTTLNPLALNVTNIHNRLCASISLASRPVQYASFLCVDNDTRRYFPIFRLNAWTTAHVLDGYSALQRTCFYIALSSYVLLWLMSGYRLVHFWLYFFLIHSALSPRAQLIRLGNPRLRVQHSFTLTILGIILALLFASYSGTAPVRS